MNHTNLFLEYTKVLIWPLILVLGFVFYNDKLFGIIENREIEAFGLKIGKQVDEVSNAYKAEIDALKDSIKQSKDSFLLKKVEIIEKNLERELAKVRETALSQEAPSSTLSRKENVKKLEQEGFTAILNRNLSAAINAFTEARVLWPDYHNISEIRKLLINKKKDLSGEESARAWKEVEKIILNEYSWGIPSDIREKLIE